MFHFSEVNLIKRPFVVWSDDEEKHTKHDQKEVLIELNVFTHHSRPELDIYRGWMHLTRFRIFCFFEDILTRFCSFCASHESSREDFPLTVDFLFQFSSVRAIPMRISDYDFTIAIICRNKSSRLLKHLFRFNEKLNRKSNRGSFSEKICFNDIRVRSSYLVRFAIQ